MSLDNAYREAGTHKDGPRWFRRNKAKIIRQQLTAIKAQPPVLVTNLLVRAGWVASGIQEPREVLDLNRAPLASDLDSHALYSHTAPAL